ncbi:MAG: hypothetical protein RLZZ292_3420 [Bacteroidota bacterium]|jgi:hypothetical protein
MNFVGVQPACRQTGFIIILTSTEFGNHKNKRFLPILVCQQAG